MGKDLNGNGSHINARNNLSDPGWLGQKIKELALLAHEQDAHRINPFDPRV
jgi:hypothetical protein